jgi:E3 ubiquitin-protein ligase RGLG
MLGRDDHAHRIGDGFATLDEVTSALRGAGLEASSLLVAIDFTSSNTWQGKKTFSGKSLHELGLRPNQYEQTLSLLARTLESFDDDRLIPAFGFGCKRTTDKAVFSFNAGGEPCAGLGSLVRRYEELAAVVNLAGPTDFAPVIRKAIEIVQSTQEFHILIIVADGQIVRPSDTPADELSEQEQATVDAIVAASHYPLSIIVVGVGDGPWEMMSEFDDKRPARVFDNFQFVDFVKTMVDASHAAPTAGPERQPFIDAYFACRALQEVPAQFAAVRRLVGKALPPLEGAPVRTLEPPAMRSRAPSGAAAEVIAAQPVAAAGGAVGSAAGGVGAPGGAAGGAAGGPGDAAGGAASGAAGGAGGLQAIGAGGRLAAPRNSPPRRCANAPSAWTSRKTRRYCRADTYSVAPVQQT